MIDTNQSYKQHFECDVCVCKNYTKLNLMNQKFIRKNNFQIYISDVPYLKI